MKQGSERVIQACLLVVALIHLTPAIGVLGSERLTLLYGIPVVGPDLNILMRHRAVMFGILGVLLVAGALLESLRNAALAAGLVSVISFLALAAAAGEYNAQIGRVVAVDVVALVLLLVAVALQVRGPGRGP